MTHGEAVNWLINVTADIGKAEYCNLWHYEQALSEIRDMLEDEPERKKGKWIYYPKASGSVTSTAVHLYPVCSECGCEHPIANYCPNCGARMEEGGE